MKSSRLFVTIALAATIVGPFGVSAEVFKIDKEHSLVGFSIRHLFSTVKGSFSDYDSIIEYDVKAPEKSTIKAAIQVKSINTGVEKRDEHLRSKDFFEVETYPVISFESTTVKMSGKNTAKISGNLTLHGVTKPVVLDATLNGIGLDPWGNRKAGFTATAKINRKDFGLTWNQALETGGALVGDEVTITLDIEADAQAPAEKK